MDATGTRADRESAVDNGTLRACQRRQKGLGYLQRTKEADRQSTLMISTSLRSSGMKIPALLMRISRLFMVSRLSDVMLVGDVKFTDDAFIVMMLFAGASLHKRALRRAAVLRSREPGRCLGWHR